MPPSLSNRSERASELRNLLNQASHAYYVLDSPFLKDQVYDALYKELDQLEKNTDNLKTHTCFRTTTAPPPKKLARRIYIFGLPNIQTVTG